MIKGARKELIVVRTSESRYFDEAYFILKEDAQKDRHKKSDILSEANRILAQIAPEVSVPRKRNNRQWLFFGMGGICGAVLSVILTLLLV